MKRPQVNSAKIVAAYLAGASSVTIGHDHAISPFVVLRILRHNGVTVRTRSEAFRLSMTPEVNARRIEALREGKKRQAKRSRAGLYSRPKQFTACKCAACRTVFQSAGDHNRLCPSCTQYAQEVA